MRADGNIKVLLEEGLISPRTSAGRCVTRHRGKEPGFSARIAIYQTFELVPYLSRGCCRTAALELNEDDF